MKEVIGCSNSEARKRAQEKAGEPEAVLYTDKHPKPPIIDYTMSPDIEKYIESQRLERARRQLERIKHL